MPRRIEGREALEVYATELGQIAIKQDSSFGEDPAVVIVDVNDVPLLVKWLQDVSTDAAEIRDMRVAATDDEQV